MSARGDDLGAIVARVAPVWLALLVLLATTLTLAFVPLGRFNVVVALAIAGMKGALVVLLFMHLRRPDPLLRLTAATALLFLVFMAMLTFADILTRDPGMRPGTVTPRTTPGAPPATGVRLF